MKDFKTDIVCIKESRNRIANYQPQSRGMELEKDSKWTFEIRKSKFDFFLT